MLKPLPIVKAYSFKGKLLVNILKILLMPLHWIYGKKWAAPPQYFHDDPRHYTRKDLIFFAYKYYFKSPLKDDDNGGTIQFFKNNPPIFHIPPDFEEITSLSVSAA